jgi:L-aminopeptidase/D-esterase-like protein
MTPNLTLTAVPGITVGHHTLAERPTGCTVILAEAGATAGVDVRGGAPGTRETDLLNPVNSIQTVHAIVLSGGSAFGLDTASGVMRYLDERHLGVKVGASAINVPIVPAAVIFDLGVGDPAIRPSADTGYEAARRASSAPVTEGNAGAGAGATVGKMGRPGTSMKGGLGTAALELPNGLVVAALVVVNAIGDVVDPATGEVVAGVRTADGGHVADLRRQLRLGGGDVSRRAGENTTIGVVATNAPLTKAEATLVARMAHDGLARALVPAHTPWDGDTIFVLATGERAVTSELGLIGFLAAEVVADAVLRGVRQAVGVPGYPSARDLVA